MSISIKPKLLQYIKNAFDFFPINNIAKIKEGHFDDDKYDSIYQINNLTVNWVQKYFNKEHTWMKFLSLKLNIADLNYLYFELNNYLCSKISLVNSQEYNETVQMTIKLFFNTIIKISLKLYHNGIYFDQNIFEWYKSKGFYVNIRHPVISIEDQLTNLRLVQIRLNEMKNNGEILVY